MATGSHRICRTSKKPSEKIYRRDPSARKKFLLQTLRGWPRAGPTEAMTHQAKACLGSKHHGSPHVFTKVKERQPLDPCGHNWTKHLKGSVKQLKQNIHFVATDISQVGISIFAQILRNLQPPQRASTNTSQIHHVQNPLKKPRSRWWRTCRSFRVSTPRPFDGRSLPWCSHHRSSLGAQLGDWTTQNREKRPRHQWDPKREVDHRHQSPQIVSICSGSDSLQKYFKDLKSNVFDASWCIFTSLCQSFGTVFPNMWRMGTLEAS